MKNVSVTMIFVALLFASGIEAADITISWQTTGTSLGNAYLPKSASDGLQNVATMAQASKGLGTLEYQLGTYAALTTPPSITWTGPFSSFTAPPETTPQIGHSPSIAMVLTLFGSYPATDNAIEVHQGGQDNEASLWFQLGTGNALTPTMDWATSTYYDTGYNATVAIDLNSPSKTTATVVEVHQAAQGTSALWYHVGTLTLGASPSMSSNWGTAFEINAGMNVGYAPTVSICNNVAVLVAQGTGGALWYSIGVVDTISNTVSWTDPIPYSTTGYNPTVSVYRGGPYFSAARVVVEAHQSTNGTGELTYRTGVLRNGAYGAPPSSIMWTPDDLDSPYSSGCYPSVALAFFGDPTTDPSQVSVTETHETACGTVAAVQSSFGFLSK